jgi:hypothetical protein
MILPRRYLDWERIRGDRDSQEQWQGPARGQMQGGDRRRDHRRIKVGGKEKGGEYKE